jgi:hypothetical protein
MQQQYSLESESYAVDPLSNQLQIGGTKAEITSNYPLFQYNQSATVEIATYN